MNKVALVTGASRGIGAAIAKKLGRNGYNVCVNYLTNNVQAQKIADEINGFAVQADVSDCNQIASMMNLIMDKYGKIDLLVNNAGISAFGLFTEIPDETAYRVFDVNIKGTLACTKAALPFMLHAHSGKIINISSVWGITGASCEVHYSTSKAAVIGFTKALAKEVGPSNIQVNCIAPGIIDTDMNARLNPDELSELINETPLSRIGTCNDVADAVFFLAGENSNFITGQILTVDGGFVI